MIMKVGVIGAGTMGSGIAQAFAQVEGYEVVLCDINDEFAARGKEKLKKGFDKRIAKGKMEQASFLYCRKPSGSPETAGKSERGPEGRGRNGKIRKIRLQKISPSVFCAAGRGGAGYGKL